MHLRRHNHSHLWNDPLLIGRVEVNKFFNELLSGQNGPQLGKMFEKWAIQVQARKRGVLGLAWGCFV